ncbi:hypothetical protein ACFV0T_41140 [Streptomyces sp. NPDC059582]|uniref:hypothetical protein n=1 Tax=Streptomyces sp. NPDC059582 TaxID=3346875 RepID=UPI0036A3D9D3
MTSRRDSAEPSDAATASAFLSAEAALLEARIHMLQEAIDDVDARIKAVAASLHRLTSPYS